MVLERATLSSVHQRLRRGQPRPRVNIDRIAAPLPALQLLYPLLLLSVVGFSAAPCVALFPHSRLGRAGLPRAHLYLSPRTRFLLKWDLPGGGREGRDIYISNLLYIKKSRADPFICLVYPPAIGFFLYKRSERVTTTAFCFSLVLAHALSLAHDAGARRHATSL